MSYSLIRERDGAGDSGSMSELTKVVKSGDWYEIEKDEHGSPITENNAKPKVGYCIRVGTPFSRTFSNQDWWQTTPIIEILDEGVDKDGQYVKFKTASKNESIYLWRQNN